MKYNFEYLLNGVKKQTDKLINDDFTVSCDMSDSRITVSVKPLKKLEFLKFQLIDDITIKPDDRIFTNGYQSWTVSREYKPEESMSEFRPRILGIEKVKLNPLGIWGAGDLKWHKYPERSGVFYGYSYAYVRSGDTLTLYGSLSERAGFTILTFDTNSGTLTIDKDLEGVELSEEKQVLDLAIIRGEYDSAFDEYFALMNIDKPRVSRKCGYTTWYNYYTNVTEEIVNRDLEAINALDKELDIFQIDDGYERTVGDWLVTDSVKFPNGMKAIADKIHNSNMLAGLWLAPFGATPKSFVFKEHKDWFVTDKKGRLRYCSHNWGGFYALDIYNPEVRDYIRKVFDTVLNEWGYDMVKLDFLYACCQRPIHNKSRGEIMCEAMDFLRECCGDKIILGCGVPLAPAFGKVDFCRIGADVGLCWENKAFSREDVSTQNTLTNTINRRHLDGRAWLNDPDVFLLRDNNIKMSLPQREIVAKVNSLCGNLLFVSDNISTYTAKQKEIFLSTMDSERAEIISADITDGIATVKTSKEEYRFNLTEGKRL